MMNRKYVTTVIAVAAAMFMLISTASIAGTPTIDINTASVEELATLKRVGKAYAERIVADREANGPFNSPQEITRVKGIGQKTYEQNKDVIVVGTPKKK